MTIDQSSDDHLGTKWYKVGENAEYFQIQNQSNREIRMQNSNSNTTNIKGYTSIKVDNAVFWCQQHTNGDRTFYPGHLLPKGTHQQNCNCKFCKEVRKQCQPLKNPYHCGTLGRICSFCCLTAMSMFLAPWWYYSH